MKKIYVQLLNEGTKVYRQVSATKVENNIYKIEDDGIYDPDDETWEFIPGEIVIVEEHILDGECVLLAVNKSNLFE